MQVWRGRNVGKGREGLVREIGLRGFGRQVNCNGHINHFWIMPSLSRPWHQTQITKGFVGG